MNFVKSSILLWFFLFQTYTSDSKRNLNPIFIVLEYCILNTYPPIAGELSQLTISFQLTELSAQKDKLSILIPEGVTEYIQTESANLTLNLNEGSLKSILNISKNSNNQIEIDLIFEEEIVGGLIDLATLDDGTLGFRNPFDFSKLNQIICSYNLLEEYIYEWRPVENVPRLFFTKSGVYNRTPYVFTTIYFRFNINSFADGDEVTIRFNPEFVMAYFDMGFCTISALDNPRISSSISLVSCEYEVNTETYLKQIKIRFPGASLLDDYLIFSPYSTFEVQVNYVRISWNEGAFLFDAIWEKGDSLKAQTKTYLEVYYDHINNFTLLEITERSHETISSLSFFISITRQFNAGDILILEMQNFDFNPDEISSTCSFSDESVSCYFDSETRNITLTNMSEENEELEVLLENIRNPSNNAAYIVNLYWYSQTTFVDNSSLEIPIQFSYFEFGPTDNKQFGEEDITYTFSFNFLDLNPFSEGWFVLIKFPEVACLSNNPSCSNLQNEESMIECTVWQKHSDQIYLNITLEESVEAGGFVEIEIAHVNNPSIPAFNHSYFFYFFDQTGLKKAIYKMLVSYSCEDEYFLDTSGSVCLHCLFPCKQCIYSGSRCTSCATNAYLIHQQTCVIECPPGTYQNQVSKRCELCPPNCGVCSYNVTTEQLECTSCFTDYFLNFNSSCQLCTTQNCNKCNKNTPSICEDCKQHYFLSEGACFKCDPNCLDCEDSTGNCISCKLDMLYYNNKCYDECPEGTFQEGNNCLKCSSPTIAFSMIMDDFMGLLLLFPHSVILSDDAIDGYSLDATLCESLFSEISVNKFGERETLICAITRVPPYSLYIIFGSNPSHKEGDELVFKNNRLLTKGCPNSYLSIQTLSVPSYYLGQPPCANIFVPNRISSKDQLTFQLTQITRMEGKPLELIKWEIDSVRDSSANISYINSELIQICENCPSITLPGGLFPSGYYIFKATLRNRLKLETTIYASEIEIIESPVPLFKNYDQVKTINSTYPLLLDFAVILNSTEDEILYLLDYNYEWVQVTDHPVQNESVLDFPNSPKLFFPSQSLYPTENGDPYIFQITAYLISDDSIYATAKISINVVQEQPSCKIFGTGPKFQNEFITLTAERSSYILSSDPGNSKYELQYTWTCSKGESECYYSNGAPVTVKAGMKIKFFPFAFENNQKLTFTLTCTYPGNGESSAIAGTITIYEPQANIINYYCPPIILAFPGFKRPLACIADLLQFLSLGGTEMFSFEWTLENFDSEFLINSISSPYLIISGDAFPSHNYHNKIGLKIWDAPLIGKSELLMYSINLHFTGSVSISFGSGSNSKGFSEILYLNIQDFIILSTSEVYYFVYWAIKVDSPEWQFVTHTSLTQVTTTLKPCIDIIFKVELCDINFCSPTYSEIVTNGIGCSAPTIDEIFQQIDLDYENDLIAAIQAAMYILQKNSWDSLVELTSAKDTIMEHIYLFDQLSYEIPHREYPRQNELALMIYLLFKNTTGCSVQTTHKAIYILQRMASREKRAILRKGTSDALYIDLMEITAYNFGISQERLEYIYITLDNIIDILNNTGVLLQNKRNEDLLSLITDFGKLIAKDFYPFETPTYSVSLQKKYYNITIAKQSRLLFSSLSYKGSSYQVDLGLYAFSADLNSISLPYLFLMAEIDPILYGPQVENPLTTNYLRLGFFAEDTQESFKLSSITFGLINITMQLNLSILERLHVLDRSGIGRVDSGEEYSSSLVTTLNYTDTAVTFSLNSFPAILDLTAKQDSYYITVIGESKIFKSNSIKNFAYDICLIAFLTILNSL